jgi:hypothetical protein
MSTLELRQPGPGPLRLPAVTAGLPGLPAASGVDRVIRVSTAAVVVAVAGIAAYISWRHACAVVRQYGETGLTAELEPATIDGLVYASGMVILYAARHRLPVPKLARWMLALGIAASLAVNVAQGWSHGLVGAVVAAWPAVSLVGSYELLAWIIRTAASSGPGHVPGADHGVPRTDQPRTIGQPAVPQPREAVTAAVPGDGASPRPGSAHDRVPVACAAALVRGPGPGGPGGTSHADQGNHAGGPVRESSVPRGPGGPAAPVPATATAPDGDTDAAAVAAYRASVREGMPLSERKLAQAFGKTSRRWARNRMAEAGQEPVAG